MPIAFHSIILAAGQGTRMKSSTPKVLHPLLGRSLLGYPVELVRTLGATSTTIVVGHQAQRVIEAFEDKADTYHLRFAHQAEQRGTGHAVLCARDQLPPDGTVLILTGDTPLIEAPTIEAFLAAHQQADNRITVLAADYPDPTGYGRILRGDQGEALGIVEEKDATPEQKTITLGNTGLFLCDIATLFTLLDQLRPENAQGEYYLTDIVGLARKAGISTGVHVASDYREFFGINDRSQLAEAGRFLQNRIVRDHLRAGVTIMDPQRVYIEADVQIGADSTLEPMVHLAGTTTVGADCTLEMGVRIEDCTLADGVRVKAHSVLENSRVGDRCSIGPLAHLRPGTELATDVHIGNYVETKKTRIGAGSKANHLTYLGDTDVGEGVNIGAGTITCNYDGVNKHKTQIDDGAFIGSDSQLVAPVRVGKRAVVGAGTTVTRDVPDEALAVSRTAQKNIAGYQKSRTKKKQ